MTEDDLRAIEARVAAASPWPWTVLEQVGGIAIASTPGTVIDAGCGCNAVSMRRADADFIAAARADVPALVGRVRWLERLLADARAALRDDEDG